MTVAKGKLFVSAEQLSALLQLPEGVEILALRPKVHDDGFEFLLVSAEETVLTEKVPLSKIRKIDLELEVVHHTGGFVTDVPFPEVRTGQVNIEFDYLGGVTINDKPVYNTPKEKTVQDSFKDVLNRKGIF